MSFNDRKLTASECATISGIGGDLQADWRKRGLMEGIGHKHGDARQARVTYSLEDVLTLWWVGQLPYRDLEWRFRAARNMVVEQIGQETGAKPYCRFFVIFEDVEGPGASPMFVPSADVNITLQRHDHLSARHIQVIDLLNFMDRMPNELIDGLRSLRAAQEA